MALVTVQQVRDISGAPTDLIDDTQLQRIIDQAQEKTLSYFNVNITPRKILEIRDGNGKNQIRVNRPFIWKLTNLQVRINTSETTTIDIEDTVIDPRSGLISLRTFAGTPYLGSQYFWAYPNSVRMEYLSALMEKTVTVTESTDATIAGSTVAIAVDDETGFAVDDWVLIEGLDGNREAAKVTATDTSEITVDSLVQTHESGSVITLLQTHEMLTQFVLYESAVSVAINAVGGTYTIATSYSYPEYTVTKGVPYPHWEKSASENQKQRDIIKNRLFAILNPIS